MKYIKNPKNLKQEAELLFGKNYVNCIHEERNSVSFGAYDNKTLVGFISSYLQILDKPFKKKIKSLFIDTIIISKDYRRKGIGKKFVKLSEEYAKKKNFYQIESWSSLDKKEALNMWYKLDYGLCFSIDLSERTGEYVEGYRVVKKLTKKMNNA